VSGAREEEAEAAAEVVAHAGQHDRQSTGRVAMYYNTPPGAVDASVNRMLCPAQTAQPACGKSSFCVCFRQIAGLVQVLEQVPAALVPVH